MHVAHLTKLFEAGPDFGTLGVGDWLMHDRNAFEMAFQAERGTVTLSTPQIARRPLAASSNPLIIRSGAWGDLLLLSPILDRLSKGFYSLTLSCAPKHHCLFLGAKFSLINYPVPLLTANEYDSVIDLGDVMETNRELHATDAFADAIGTERPTDYRPTYRITDEETLWAWTRYPKSSSPRVGIQMISSTPNKNYPINDWLRVISQLVERGWEVMLLGEKILPPMKGTKGRVHCCYAEGFDFRQSAAILSTCQAFCGIDSVFVHLCHALDIPAIGLYGPFPWELYTSKAPKTRALSGHGDCAPCFWHYHAGRQFPPNMPCAKDRKCSVMATIKVETIVAKVDALQP